MGGGLATTLTPVAHNASIADLALHQRAERRAERGEGGRARSMQEGLTIG